MPATSFVIPLIAQHNVERPPIKRSATDTLINHSRPRVSSVNANFETVVNGQTVREAVDDLFLRGATVHSAPPIRAMQRQVNSEQQALIDQLLARVAALELAVLQMQKQQIRKA